MKLETLNENKLMINRILLAFLILHSSFLIGFAQPITPPIPSTPFTRTFLRATNAEAAVAALGMTGVTLTNYAGTAASATNAQYLTGYTADAERYLIFTNEQGTAGISYNDLTGYFEFNALKTVKASAFEGDGSGLSGVKAATAVDATNLASTTWGGISNSAAGATNVVLANNAIKLQAGSANTLVVTNGRVGVGMLPTYTVDITGTVRSSSLASLASITFDGSQSAAGDIPAGGCMMRNGTLSIGIDGYAASRKFVLWAYSTTNSYRSMLEYTNTTAAEPQLLLCKNGGTVTAGGTLTASNLIIGTTYPTLLSSDSTGLVTDQPLTVGGVTPSLTIGAGGPSITASGGTLNLRTNVLVGSNSVTLAAGSANTLVVTNGKVGVGTTPLAPLHISGDTWGSVFRGVAFGSYYGAGIRASKFIGDADTSGNGGAIDFLSASNATTAIVRARLETNGTFYFFSNVVAGASMLITNTLTASNIVSATSTTSTNFGFYLINGTSSNSVAGMLVEMNPLTNFAYQACAVSSQTPIGVVLDSGVAPGGSVRIADRGIVQVLVDSATTTNWPGSWFGSSATTPGRAVILTDPPSAGVHDREIGHGLAAAAFSASDATTNLQYVLLHIGR